MISRRPAEDDINAWWEGVPGERYWLDVTNRNDRNELLAAPCDMGRRSAYWVHRLITHVKDGDVVFHFDALQESIVAWSIPYGRVEKMQLSWPLAASHAEGATSRRLLSWAIGLRQFTPLGAAVPLREIAQIQWSLFPSLRALEDEVGGPLYYPFEMGIREATRPLSGYVFKLPSVLVHGSPELASAAHRVARLLPPYESVPSPRIASGRALSAS